MNHYLLRTGNKNTENQNDSQSTQQGKQGNGFPPERKCNETDQHNKKLKMKRRS